MEKVAQLDTEKMCTKITEMASWIISRIGKYNGPYRDQMLNDWNNWLSEYQIAKDEKSNNKFKLVEFCCKAIFEPDKKQEPFCLYPDPLEDQSFKNWQKDQIRTLCHALGLDCKLFA